MTQKKNYVSVKFILELLEHGFRKKAWHGPILQGSLRGVNYKTALWKPSKKRHSIWEIVLHCAYWKYIIHRRFSPVDIPKFPFKGNDWFKVESGAGDKEWKHAKQSLTKNHTQMIQAVEVLSDSDLLKTPSKSKVCNLDILYGVAYHDIYHAGQIQLLKRLSKA